MTGTARISSASRPSPTRCDSGRCGADSRLNSALPSEIERRAAEQDDRGLEVGVAAGMVQHQLVADRGDDDAGDDQDVQIGVAVARKPAGIVGAAIWRLPRSAPMLK